MNVTTNCIINYNVKIVNLQQIYINKINNDVSARIMFSWLDTNNKEIRHDTKRYLASELSLIDAQASGLLQLLASFIENPKGTTLIMLIPKEDITLYVWGPKTINDKIIFTKTLITNDDLATKGISMEILKAAMVQLTSILTSN